MVVQIITDDTDFDREYSGEVVFVDESAIEVEDGDLILWDFVVDVIIIVR